MAVQKTLLDQPLSVIARQDEFLSLFRDPDRLNREYAAAKEFTPLILFDIAKSLCAQAPLERSDDNDPNVILQTLIDAPLFAQQLKENRKFTQYLIINPEDQEQYPSTILAAAFPTATAETLTILLNNDAIRQSMMERNCETLFELARKDLGEMTEKKQILYADDDMRAAIKAHAEKHANDMNAINKYWAKDVLSDIDAFEKAMTISAKVEKLTELQKVAQKRYAGGDRGYTEPFVEFIEDTEALRAAIDAQDPPNPTVLLEIAEHLSENGHHEILGALVKSPLLQEALYKMDTPASRSFTQIVVPERQGHARIEGQGQSQIQ